VVVVVEVGAERRGTSAAARVAIAPDGPKLVFEPRDWATLAKFARWEARRSVSFPPTLREGREPSRSKRGEAAKSSKGDAKKEERETENAAPVGEVVTEGQDAGAKILLVDDDPDIREVLSAMLESVGLSVTPVGSAEEALDYVGEERVDLVILDWSLPSMTGLDLCRMLRGRAALESMPIVFLSANALTQDIDEAFANGADDYVVKPFRAPELGARIWSLLRRAELSPSAR
jgi:two-component system phosphate regulon response regulator PhoB